MVFGKLGGREGIPGGGYVFVGKSGAWGGGSVQTAHIFVIMGRNMDE